MTPPKYTRWLASKWTRRVAFVIGLFFVFLWPHADLTAELVLLASIPGVIGLVLFGLTFWQKARVQMGRLQLRYRTIRYVAGVTAAICLLVPLAQHLGTRIENHYRAQWVEEWAQDYRASRAQYRFTVAFTHFDADQKDHLVSRLMDALANIDPRLAVSPSIIDHTIAVSGDKAAIGHLQALDFSDEARAYVVVWGKAATGAPEVGPIFVTDHGDETPFTGAYLPSDFRLPNLPVEDAGNLLQLVVATRSAELMQRWGFDFGDALEPSIKQLRALNDDTSKSAKWAGDTRARVDFALGVAMRISADQTQVRDSLNGAVSMFQKALSEWSREANPLEWAMTQLNLGETLQELSGERNLDALHKALDAYSAALPVYQSRSDKLDTASIQFQMGWTLELISTHEGTHELARQAIDRYHAALAGFDMREHPLNWAAVQFRLGRILASLASDEEDTAMYAQAIAARKAALQVYSKEHMPRQWVETESDLADNLTDLGRLTSNRQYLKDALSICKEILEVYPRGRNPAVWATAQATLAHALETLGELNRNVDELHRAGEAYQAALSELSPERDAWKWASAKDGLAETYADLGEITGDTFYLGQAVRTYNEALTVFTREWNPVLWAWTKYNLANVLYELGGHEQSNQHIAESIHCYREALSALSRDKNPRQWTTTNDNLQTALDELRRRGG
ncbi:MAG TPA: tetratricopeptide repeat protein [Candidatus Binataceae bacterium]|nr:tetratricopeptide repeat protein [Candidatus Binataceae bacterium]